MSTLTQHVYHNLSPFQSVCGRVSMDFITGLPKAQGKDCIFVVVDRLTKFSHFFSNSMDFSTSQVEYLFFKEVFKLHGIPKMIVSDMENMFMSIFFQELFRLVHPKLTPITSYHPQTYGKTERMNQIVEDMLQMYVRMKPTKWEEYLHLVEFSYNNGYHTSAKMSPFEVLYDRKCTTLISWDNLVDRLMMGLEML